MNTHDDAIQEEAAMLFAAGEKENAINALLDYLEKNPKTSGADVWLVLMEVYQSVHDYASFERLAGIYAQRFQSSPPSWREVDHPRSGPVFSRNVLVLEGAPRDVSADRWRDFLASAKEVGVCRLDVSRVRLPDGPAEFEKDAQALLQLMDRLNRQQVRILLMGDGALREVLQKQIQIWPIGSTKKVAVELLLGFLQWRGLEDEFQVLAMQYMDDFDRSPPGYEIAYVLAENDPTPETDSPVRVLDETGLAQFEQEWLDAYRRLGKVEMDWSTFDRVTYPAALALATFIDEQGLGRARLIMKGASRLIRTLFDLTGVSDLVTYSKRTI